MLLATTNASALPSSAPPAGTADWLAGRDARAKAAPARRSGADASGGASAGTEEDGGTPRVVDEKARARRVATREKRVDAGLEELRTWLRDLARRGLAEVMTE